MKSLGASHCCYISQAVCCLKNEWADTHVLPSVSRTITVCFGAIANWPKRAVVNPSQKGCQQACSTQRSARLFDFLLHPR